MLKVENVAFRYRKTDRDSVHDMNFVARPGITAVVGVNGAGKTTLMRILARALRPSSGRVLLGHDDIHRRRRALTAAKIGYMPQDFRVPDRSTVADVVTYLGWLRGLSTTVARERAAKVMAEVSLSKQLDRPMKELSGGMTRRVALAQALIADPQLLLLDEPTTGLDPQQRASVRELISHPRIRGRITLLSSHVMEDVATLADHVLVVNDGRLIFAGGMPQFCELPDGNRVSAEEAFLRRIEADERSAA